MHSEAGSLAERIRELRAGIRAERNFHALFERFYPPVYRFFAKRGFAAEDCRDLTQETFLGVYKGIGGFRAESRFETWLFGIAANVWRKRLRSQSAAKRKGTEIGLDETTREGERPLIEKLPDTTPEGGTPADHLLGREREAQLAAAIAELPDRMRRCLVLRVHQELSYREIATVLQISIETVKAHLHQARRRLEDRLEAGEGSA